MLRHQGVRLRKLQSCFVKGRWDFFEPLNREVIQVFLSSAGVASESSIRKEEATPGGFFQ